MVLFVDDIMVGASQQLPDGTELNDSSPSCTLFFGQRANSSSSSSSSSNHFRIKDAVYEAAFVDRMAIIVSLSFNYNSNSNNNNNSIPS